MIYSMTAFARNEQSHPFGHLCWELRSVNQRFLDINLRLPEECRAIEPKVRNILSTKLKRGKIDASLRYKAAPQTQQALELNTDYASKIIQACASIQSLDSRIAAPRATEILHWPGVIRQIEQDVADIAAAALAQLDSALDELIANRAREGQRLQPQLLQRCEDIAQLVAQVQQRRPEVIQQMRSKIETKLSQLQIQTDRDRVEQELVLLTQRLDVDEELERLRVHISEIRDVLTATTPTAVGRRLDFLTQELNREANTLGAKAADTTTTQAAVDIKVLIEQIREQVQNIE